MLKPFRQTKLIATLLLLLAFIGQSAAVLALPCQMQMGSNSSVEMPDCHLIDAQEQMNSASNDCCADGMHCPQNSCSQAPGLMQNLTTTGLNIETIGQAFSFIGGATVHAPTSLYRPPII